MIELITNYKAKEIPKGRKTSDYRYLFEEDEYKKRLKSQRIILKKEIYFN